jgi:hypothetical protein
MLSARVSELRSIAEETAAAFQAKAKHMPVKTVLADDMLREIDTQMYIELAKLRAQSR